MDMVMGPENRRKEEPFLIVPLPLFLCDSLVCRSVANQILCPNAICSDLGITGYSAPPVLSHTRLGERVIHPLDTTRVARMIGERDVSADAAGFIQTFKMLAEETRASYELFYYPDFCDGKFHDLRLKTSHPGVQLRVTHNGYLAAAK